MRLNVRAFVGLLFILLGWELGCQKWKGITTLSFTDQPVVLLPPFPWNAIICCQAAHRKFLQHFKNTVACPLSPPPVIHIILPLLHPYGWLYKSFLCVQFLLEGTMFKQNPSLQLHGKYCFMLIVSGGLVLKISYCFNIYFKISVQEV